MVDAIDEIGDAVLSHVARYRLTLPRILAKTGLLANRREQTAEATLERLAESGWLQKADLVPETKAGAQYYYLSPRAAKRLGYSADLAQALKRDMRLECFAVATFCCLGPVFRQAFTKAEFIGQFQSIWYPGQPVRYYLEPTQNGGPRLAFLKVDKGGPGRWDRLIDSCARFLRQRTNARAAAAEHRPQVDAFAELLNRQQFQITVLTALPEKKRAIEVELVRRIGAGEQVPPLHVHVVPGLFELMFPAVRVRGNGRAYTCSPAISSSSTEHARHIATLD